MLLYALFRKSHLSSDIKKLLNYKNFVHQEKVQVISNTNYLQPFFPILILFQPKDDDKKYTNCGKITKNLSGMC